MIRVTFLYMNSLVGTKKIVNEITCGNSLNWNVFPIIVSFHWWRAAFFNNDFENIPDVREIFLFCRFFTRYWVNFIKIIKFVSRFVVIISVSNGYEIKTDVYLLKTLFVNVTSNVKIRYRLQQKWWSLLYIEVTGWSEFAAKWCICITLCSYSWNCDLDDLKLVSPLV